MIPQNAVTATRLKNFAFTFAFTTGLLTMDVNNDLDKLMSPADEAAKIQKFSGENNSSKKGNTTHFCVIPI
jgi:hypothetical protein